MKWNLPNKITLARMLLIPVFLVVLMGGFWELQTARYISVAIFIVASATDALDGHIARSRHLITNLGIFMDPLVDKLLVSAALIAMVELGDLPAWVVIIIISRDSIINGLRFVAASQNIVMAAGNLGKTKTTVQMIMVVVVLSDIQIEIVQTIGFAFIIAAVVLTVVSGVEYIYKNLNVLKED